MPLERFPEILLLSLEEKLQLIFELEYMIEVGSGELTPEQIQELDRRWQAFVDNPGSLLTFEELKERIASRK